MNKQQKPKHHFVRLWLDEVLVRCRNVRGFLLHLRTKGHLNDRYTSLNDEMMLDIETFLRIEVNMAMVADDEDFLEHWTEIGTIVCKFAKEHGREFNKAYESQNNKY